MSSLSRTTLPREPRARARTPLAVGALALLAGVSLNEWTVPALFGREPFSLQPHRVLAIRWLQVAALTGGLALLLNRYWWRGAVRALRATAARWSLADPERRLMLALVPYCAVDAVFWTLGCLRDEIRVVSVMALLALAHKLVLDGLHVLVAGLLLVRISRARHAAILAPLAWGAAVVTEVMLYWFGRTRLQSEHLELVERASLAAYTGPGTVLFTLTALGLCAWSGLLLARAAPLATWRTIGRASALALVLTVVDMPRRYSELARPFRGPLERDTADAQYARLAYLERDSLFQLVAKLTAPAPEVTRIEDLAPYRELIERYGIGIGAAQPEPLWGPDEVPFERVVFIVAESLSLHYSQLHNPELPGALTPFLDSLLAARGAFHRHRANTQPTLPGLIVTFLSHPNPHVGRSEITPPSLVNLLAAAGWKAQFVRSDPRQFGGSNLVLRNLGFDEQMGREDFLADPARAHYVAGWGACDRVVFDEAVERLAASRDQDLFLTVLTCDTHTPRGRLDYRGLEYPPAPDWIHDFPALAPLLESVFRFDRDLERFLDQLERRGLFDERTLVILTADHSCPITVELQELPGIETTPFGGIPLLFLTPRELPPSDRELPTSQLDVAPSLLHLLGLEAPRGMWGTSVFDPHRPEPVFLGWFRDQLTVGLGDQRRSFALDVPPTPELAQLTELFNAWVR